MKIQTLAYSKTSSLKSARKTLHIGSLVTLLSSALLASLTPQIALGEVNIVQAEQLRYPDVLVPTRTGRITIDWNGDVTKVQGATTVGNYWSSGDFVLQSDSSSTITINIFSNQDTPNVTLSKMILRYKGKTYRKFPASGLPNPGTGSNANLGMLISFTTAVPPGIVTPSYTIEVTEDNP